MLTVLEGDCIDRLRELPDQSVHCCVCSPPYWGLRDYGTAKWEGGDEACDHKQGRNGSGRADGIIDDRGQRNRDGAGAMGGDCGKCGAKRIDSQIGLEKTPQEYVSKMVSVFREVWRVLRDDGTLWLNLGSSYATGGHGGHNSSNSFHGHNARTGDKNPRHIPPDGFKSKDMIPIPWMVAMALQQDGWYLRQDIIWHKPNPMPESVTDRCTKAHEYIFLMSKSERYFYDAAAISEPCQPESWHNSDFRRSRNSEIHPNIGNGDRNARGETRNKRSVWTVAPAPYSEAHFATFPPDLIKPCILAGSPAGGTVLDPFAGSGTTGMVALELGRKAILIELNPDYVKLIHQRCNVTPGLAMA